MLIIWKFSYGIYGNSVLSYTFPVHLHFSEIKSLLKHHRKSKKIETKFKIVFVSSRKSERNETHGGLIFYYVGDIYIFIVLDIHVYFTNYFVCIFYNFKKVMIT